MKKLTILLTILTLLGVGVVYYQECEIERVYITDGGK